MPEGAQEQYIENLLENIMKENLPNLAKEIDFQEVREAQRIPKKLGHRKQTPRHIIITYPRLKRTRESQKQQEKRRQLPTKECPYNYQLISQEKLYRQEEAGKKYSKS